MTVAARGDVGLGSMVPRYALSNPAAAGTDTALVAAVAGKKIRVLALAIIAGDTETDLTLNSKGSGAGTAISCKFANGVNSGEVLPFSPVGWFETNVGEALTTTTGAGSPTGVQVVYIAI